MDGDFEKDITSVSKNICEGDDHKDVPIHGDLLMIIFNWYSIRLDSTIWFLFIVYPLIYVYQ